MLEKDVKLIDVDSLIIELNKFSKIRDWDKFHSPKNLVMALTGEVGELNEIFQWKKDSDFLVENIDIKDRENISHEIADILFYLLKISDVLHIDLNEAAKNKLSINEKKYPVDIFFGSSKKYNEI